MKITETRLRNMIAECIKEMYNNQKDIYAKQWADEKQMFFDGLANGEALIDNGFVAVAYQGTANSNDPRWIYYKEGDNFLTDDHFSMQHSPELDLSELKDIQWYAEKEGMHIDIPDYLYAEEEYEEEN